MNPTKRAILDFLDDYKEPVLDAAIEGDLIQRLQARFGVNEHYAQKVIAEWARNRFVAVAESLKSITF